VVGVGLDDVGVGDFVGLGLELVGDGVGDGLEVVGLGVGEATGACGGMKLSTGCPSRASVMNAVQIVAGYPPPVNTDIPPTPLRGACGSFFKSR
jgi:hypothetical protein